MAKGISSCCTTGRDRSGRGENERVSNDITSPRKSSFSLPSLLQACHRPLSDSMLRRDRNCLRAPDLGRTRVLAGVSRMRLVQRGERSVVELVSSSHCFVSASKADVLRNQAYLPGRSRGAKQVAPSIFSTLAHSSRTARGVVRSAHYWPLGSVGGRTCLARCTVSTGPMEC